MVAGVVSLIVGASMNNSLEAQLSSLFGGGGVNPGTPWIIIGIIAAIVGLVLLVIGIMKKKKG